MREGFSGLIAVLLVTVTLAGCSGSSTPESNEIIVESAASPEGGEVPTVPDPPKKGQRGHLAGFVVDDSLRPIPGVAVTLPGIDLTDESDRDGSFAFADLLPGPYLLRANYTGHQSLEAVVKIKSDEFTRVKVVLKRIPPPEPYHETFKFAGFSSLTDHSLLPNFFTSSGARNDIHVGLELEALVLEAIMEPYAGADVGVGTSNSFTFQVSDADCCRTYQSGSLPNPMRVVIGSSALPENHTAYEITVKPESFPLPESNKDYEVFVTAFYRAPPPEGWSFLEGDGE